MAVTLFQDTFLTLSEAETFNGQDLFWLAASTNEKEAALRAATSALNENNWLSTALDSAQLLSWPRKAFSFFDKALNLSVLVPEATVPRRLQLAVANLALHYLEFPQAKTNYEATFDRIKLGPLEVEDTNTGQQIPSIPLKKVKQVLDPLLTSSGTSALWWRAN